MGSPVDNSLPTANQPDSPAAPAPAAPADTPVLVIPRTVFNYVVIAIVFFVLGALTSAAGSTALFNANSAENERLVREAVAQAVQARGDTAAGSTEPNPNQRYDVSYEGDPFLGTADAPVVIVEFSDFNCGFCGRYARETLQPLVDAYGDQVRFVYRDYPFLAATSLDAALAAQCAHEQDNFWGYHNALFMSQGQFTREQFLNIAQSLKLDMAAFTSCLDSQKYRDEVVEDALAAQELGVRGTPAFFVNGRFISGAQPYQVFAQAIDAELAALAGG